MRTTEPCDIDKKVKKFWQDKIDRFLFPDRTIETLRKWYEKHIKGKSMKQILANEEGLMFCHEFQNLKQVDLSDISAENLQRLEECKLLEQKLCELNLWGDISYEDTPWEQTDKF